MYASINFKTRGELVKAVRDGLVVSLKPETNEPVVEYGAIDIRGPWHYNSPLWTARVIVRRRHIIKVSRWEPEWNK